MSLLEKIFWAMLIVRAPPREEKNTVRASRKGVGFSFVVQ